LALKKVDLFHGVIVITNQRQFLIAEQNFQQKGEPLWLSGKVVKDEKINEIERTWVRSPPQATSLKKSAQESSTCPYLGT
jgi:hypothetical protein